MYVCCLQSVGIGSEYSLPYACNASTPLPHHLSCNTMYNHGNMYAFSSEQKMVIEDSKSAAEYACKKEELISMLSHAQQ